MFSKGSHDLKVRKQREREHLCRLHGDDMTPAKKERRIMRIYGKTSDDLARAYQDRVDTFVASLDEPQVSALLLGRRAQEQAPSQHRFRDRTKVMEIGRPYVSSKRTPVRAVFRGGGVFNAAATANLAEQPQQLDEVVR